MKSSDGFRPWGIVRHGLVSNSADAQRLAPMGLQERPERPQLVLLDITLPGEDGIAILKKLRGQSAAADLPVIKDWWYWIGRVLF